MGYEPLLPEPNSPWSKLKQKVNENFPLAVLTFVSIPLLIVILFFIGVAIRKEEIEEENYVPNITIPSMELTVLNITETRLSVKGDLFIRIPGLLPGYFTCLKGYFQVFLLYKDVTIATSSIESYKLIPLWPQLLNVSSIASKGDIDGLIVKDIMEDIKERGEIRFGSRVILPDCRRGTNGKMNFACDDDMLRLEPDSATLVGNNVPTCYYVR